MKANAKLRICVAAVAGGLLASGASLAPARAAAPKVVVTIKPVHSLVAAVMAGVGAPKLLVEGQASPHSFALKPSGARAVAEADILVRVSEVVEPFTHKVTTSLPRGATLLTLEDAPGVRLLELRRGATFEAHAHHEPGHHAAGDHHDGHHDNHHGDHHGDHDAEVHDGHIWLDPDNAKAMVDAIVAVLSARDPVDAPRYRENGATLKTSLDTLAAELAAELKPVAGKPFIVFHDSTQYFETRFGLSAAGAITVSPEVSPSAKRLTAVRERIKKLGAVCVLSEPQMSARVVAAVTEGSRAKAGAIDPEGQLLEPPGPDLYPTLMRKLAKAMASCLQ
jgi:zinc transport system substrate-binding protein